MFLLSGVEHWETYVFAVTRDEFEWKTIPLKTKALEEKVAAFRRGLDVDALARGLQRAECTQSEADKRGSLSRAECASAQAERGAVRSWPRARALRDAHRPRRAADQGQAASHCRALGRAHGAAVPSAGDGEAGGRVPAVDAPGDLAAYRNAAWLLKRHAVSVLPSVASLKALRVFARKDEAKAAADRLRRPCVQRRGRELSGCAGQNLVGDALLYRVLERRGHRPHDAGQALPRLPETAAELRAVAQNLGAPASSIHLRQAASETTVKRAALVRLPRRLFRHPRARRRRGQGTGGAIACADVAEAAERSRRWPAHRQRGGAAQAQRRLGGALRLQHHCRRQARRGSIVRTCPRVLLCRRARAARLALGGGVATPRCGSPPRPSTS